MNEAEQIYDFLEKNNALKWKAFARTKLGLSNLEVEECEMNNMNDMREQRYQMVLKWRQKQGRCATIKKLWTLVGDHVPQSEVNPSLVPSANHQPRPMAAVCPIPDAIHPSQTNEASGSNYFSSRNSVQGSISPRFSNLSLKEGYCASSNASSKNDKLQSPTCDHASPFPPDGPESTTAKSPDMDQNGDIVKKASSKQTAMKYSALDEEQLKNPSSVTIPIAFQSSQEPVTARDAVPIETSETKKTSRRRESNDQSVTSSSSEHLGSLESVGKSEKKKERWRKKLWRKISGRKKSKTKSTETAVSSTVKDMPNYCDKVDQVNVQPVSQVDIENWKKIENTYPTDLNKGCVLIINNSFPNDNERRRKGSEIDVENMLQLWTQMGCDIHRLNAQIEKTADEMRALLKEMTSLRQEYSFLVIIIMTHGGLKKGEIVFDGVDDKAVSVCEIEKIFDNYHAPRLQNIPKLFIFQFCCGYEEDRGVKTVSANIDRSLKGLVSHTEPGIVQTDSGKRLPTVSDTIILYPTQKGNVALREPETGSWLITAITNVFMRYARCENVSNMITKVHQAMKNKDGTCKEVVDGKENYYQVKAMSKHESNLSKLLFLLPGYHGN